MNMFDSKNFLSYSNYNVDASIDTVLHVTVTLPSSHTCVVCSLAPSPLCILIKLPSF